MDIFLLCVFKISEKWEGQGIFVKENLHLTKAAEYGADTVSNVSTYHLLLISLNCECERSQNVQFSHMLTPVLWAPAPVNVVSFEHSKYPWVHNVTSCSASDIFILLFSSSSSLTDHHFLSVWLAVVKNEHDLFYWLLPRKWMSF